jgi:hypothetical protein
MPQGAKMQPSNDRYSSSLSEAPSSISARWRPEYSSTIASCTMVNSRWVAGLSTGMRAFSAIATMTSASRASASDTRRPTSAVSMKRATEDSSVVPASSDRVNTIINMAGSASEAIIISRLEPMPPKLVPTSSPASARKKAGGAEQGDDGDQIRRPTERQAAGEGRHQRRRHPQRGENQIGRHPKQPGSGVGQHHLLAQQLGQVAVGLQPTDHADATTAL